MAALATGVLLALAASSLPVAACRAGTTAAAPTCVDVTVDGQPTLAYDCLNRQLARSGATPAATAVALDAVAQLPPNQQVGQFDFSALSHRMGANLGKSVHPQRPPPAIPARPSIPAAGRH